MAQRHLDLLSGIDMLTSFPVPLRSVRAPLDIKRQQVCSPQWEPFLLMDLKVGCTPDLVEILHEVQKVEARTSHHLPLLVDENIHYRILKLAYSSTYKEFNVPFYLNRTPLLYGVWHPYKYALTLVYRAFFSFTSYFAYGQLSTNALVPSFPKLIFMERLFITLFHVGTRLRAFLDRKVNILANRPLESLSASEQCEFKILKSVQVLLFQYIPALFILGKGVRDCHWGGRSPWQHKCRGCH